MPDRVVAIGANQVDRGRFLAQFAQELTLAQRQEIGTAGDVPMVATFSSFDGSCTSIVTSADLASTINAGKVGKKL